MNLFKKIENEIKAIIDAKKLVGFFPPTLVIDKIEVTPPREAAHGDMATNAALILAPQLSAKPKEVAEQLLPEIQNIKGIAHAEIAGPGFINITLSPDVWQEELLEILKLGTDYGNSNIGQGQKINVEYVSANPTGPMHVGHARYIYGDALATLLIKAGYNVTREYYINDAGSQIDKLIDSAFLRYREACGEKIEIPEGLYPGDYLIPVGEGLHKLYGNALLKKQRPEWLQEVRNYTLNAMMDLIKSDLAAIGIKFDVFSSEQAIRDAGKVDEAIAMLEKKGLVYTGVLEPPKGKPVPDDWESRPQTLFKSTQFGDDLDRPVKKSDGSWTYFAPDIAYQLDKINRGYDKLIMLLGVDHGGYVKRLKAAVKALSDGKVELEIKLCQLVKFMRAGEPLKMSKRAGTFVTVREVVDEVGKDVFRFIMLTRKNDVPLDFDFAKVTEQSKDNPVFYVQYAHARARSVIRRAADDGCQMIDDGKMGALSSNIQHPASGALARLTHPEEIALIRLMCNWPRLVESAAIGLEPHRVAFYLHDLAAAFHGFWNLGNDDIGLRFLLKDDIELSAARIALAKAVSLVIASGLMVLGVTPLEELR